jgi:conjugal transfer/entry exclusion protein
MEMQKGFPMTSDSPAKPQDSRASSRLNNPAQSVAASMMFPNAVRTRLDPAGTGLASAAAASASAVAAAVPTA